MNWVFCSAAASSWINRDKPPLFSDGFNRELHAALLTAVSFAHASSKQMQQGSGCAMTPCWSFKGYGANECPPDVFTKQGRVSLSFLLFWLGFL